MRKSITAGIFFILTAAAIAAAQPSGSVYTATVNVYDRYGSQNEKITTTAALLLPRESDEAGTAALVLRAQANPLLVEIPRSAMPKELHFVFGTAESLFIEPDSNIRSAARDHRFQFIKVEIPYDKSSPALQVRKLQILDAAGRPVQGFVAKVQLYNVDNGSPKVNVPIDEHGYVLLPNLLKPDDGENPPWAPGQSYGSLTLINHASGQQYEKTLTNPDAGKLETIIIPYAIGDAPEDLIIYEGKIINHDGSPATHARMSLAVYGADDDETTGVATVISPAKDGSFRIAVSPEIGMTPRNSTELTGAITETGKLLASNMQRFTLQAGKNPAIVLPKRLTLAAQLIDTDGNPVDLSRENTMRHQNLVLHRVTKNEDGSRPPDRSYINVYAGQNTGSVFAMRELPVPGRYYIEAFNNKYGPVDIGETSPTQIISFREAAQ